MQLETNAAELSSLIFKKVIELMPERNLCDLVILPELWLQGAFEFSKFSKETKLSNDNKSINDIIFQLKVIAQQRNYWILSGSFLILKNDNLYNETYLIDNHGQLITRYCKNYVFGFGSGEAEYVSSGNDFSLTQTPWGKIALSICYDLRFPELYRKMLAKGAEIYLVVAAWPEQRIDHWKKLISARAIENQGFFIGCNGIGIQTDATLGGHSIVVNPNGDVVSEFGNSEEVQIIEINHKMVLKTRAIFPVLKDIKQ